MKSKLTEKQRENEAMQALIYELFCGTRCAMAFQAVSREKGGRIKTLEISLRIFLL